MNANVDDTDPEVKRRFLRARGGLLRQRCMCVNQSEYSLTFLCTLQLFSIVFNSFYRY